MNIKIPDIIKEAARNLRKNQTISEKILWKELRYDKLGFRFLRQKPVYVYTENNGQDRFVIPDFYCDESKIIIEVDGNIHECKSVLELDKYKEKLLNSLGIKVLRVGNDEVLNNLNKVLNKIKNNL
ncbi:MAG: endonuclease domain-containing protein [Candidatus Gracilibacteria bacterium]